MKNKIIKYILIFTIIYILITLFLNKGRLYQRKTYFPNSINESKFEGTFIDSFYFDTIKDFEIWRCYLKYVDYYGLGGVFAHKYIPKDSCYYLALRYKGNKLENTMFKISSSDDYFTDISDGGNGIILCEKHDSSSILIYSQPGSIKTIYLVDSIFVKW